MTRQEATGKLAEAKRNLEAGLITQADFDRLRQELSNSLRGNEANSPTNQFQAGVTKQIPNPANLNIDKVQILLNDGLITEEEANYLKNTTVAATNILAKPSVVKQAPPFLKVVSNSLLKGLGIGLFFVVVLMIFFIWYQDDSVPTQDNVTQNDSSLSNNANEKAQSDSPNQENNDESISPEYNEAEFERQMEQNRQRRSYEEFANDNLTKEQIDSELFEFNITQDDMELFDSNSNDFPLDLNAPSIELTRDWEPAGITNGYQRKYFIGSEIVAIERFIEFGLTIHEIHFHPNGKIFTAGNYTDGNFDGHQIFLTAEGLIFLSGGLANGEITGKWFTPFNERISIESQNDRDKHQDTIAKMSALMHWYEMTASERDYYFKGADSN